MSEQDWAEKEAEELLPCSNRRGHCSLGGHFGRCPAQYQQRVAAALRKAAANEREAGATAEREAVLAICDEVDLKLASGWHIACAEIARRIRQRGEGKQEDEIQD